MSKSPLRYPGGKTRAVKILQTYLNEHYSTRTTLLSPFFGGGSFELSCAARGYSVYGNDLFLPLYTFWMVAKSNPTALQESVTATLPVSKEAFLERRRNIVSLSKPLEIATSYFIVNRCSFSGATFCGGYSAEAAEKRLNAAAIRRLGEVNLENVTFSNLDANDFLLEHPEGENTVVYADPPYFIESYIYGKDGDMHENFDHEKFAKTIQTRNDWMVSYNDCPYIRELYSGCRIYSVSWSYGMDNGRKPSTEILILPRIPAGVAAGP
jgi:DNA adenine methylase